MPSLDDEERAVFPEVDDEEDESDEVDDSEDDEDEDEDGEIEPSSAPLPPSVPVTDLATMDPNPGMIPNPNPIAVHAAVSAAENGSVQVQPVLSDVATEDLTTPTADERRLVPCQTGSSCDDSRRLFQRLWTDEDELVILKGFLEFVSQRGTIEASHQHDTGLFYEKIKTLLQLEFTKNQLIEKLRWMKKKFRNVVSRIANAGKDFSFKTPHEQATFEIARQIWSSALKRSREISDDEILNVPALGGGSEIKLEGGTGEVSRSRRRRRRHSSTVNAGHTVGVPVEAAMSHTPLALSSTGVPVIPSMIEETVRSCLSPLFKELIGSAAGGVGMNLMMPMSLWGGGECVAVAGVEAPEDERWRNQRILELEVYLKRVELVQDQIKKTLEDLRSIGGN
ncbi:probable transcription factor At3g04930 [Dioscorea cayenensis subsp. rotundata]|uniref:Probable transcription factor At3g04930 n=1 Tax=Dioscorea cayennensis subsp. rotundata TaxID=55577 RepID=A0AB40BMX2_DIOCR|nr:probable transcription factor At3g04930 [Dioscorea cayenensis subsp. rotundata]